MKHLLPCISLLYKLKLMPHTKSYSSKLKLNKIKLLLIFLGILLISGVVILSTPKGSLDNRNRAQVSADTDIVPAITSGTISLDQPFDIPINVINKTTKTITKKMSPLAICNEQKRNI